jgi:hypothetical protein
MITTGVSTVMCGGFDPGAPSLVGHTVFDPDYNDTCEADPSTTFESHDLRHRHEHHTSPPLHGADDDATAFGLALDGTTAYWELATQDEDCGRTTRCALERSAHLRFAGRGLGD